MKGFGRLKGCLSPELTMARGTRLLLVAWLVVVAAAVACGFDLRSRRHEDPVASAPGDLRLGPARVPAQLGKLAWPLGFSDVAPWPGGERVLLVADDEDRRLFLWRPGSAHDSDGQPQPLALPPGVDLNDGEGLATDGRYLFAISSHALKRDRSERPSTLLRLRFTAPASDATGLEAAGEVKDLKPRLEARYPALAAVAGRPSDEGGLNIEGLAWDVARSRLLIGLRGPLLDGHPLVVPARVSATGERFELHFDHELIPIPGIRGFGLRSLAPDPVGGGFVLLTGGVGAAAPGSAGRNRFALWRWSGEEGEPAVRLLEFPHHIDEVELKPEGVCGVQQRFRRHFLLVVTDGSAYYWQIPLATGAVVSR